MPQLYELSTFNENVPFHCSIFQIGVQKSHMHDFFEIIFILQGNCNFEMNDQIFCLNEGDIITIERHVTHQLQASDCVYISIQLDQNKFEQNFKEPIHPEFYCNSQIPGHEQEFKKMRYLIAKIAKNNADQQMGYELRNWIYLYQLIEILFMHFRVEKSILSYKKNHRYGTRIAEITKIIKEHYKEDLTLSKMADMVHLSSPYLSKFFQEQFGMNYLTYLTHLRLNNALHDLLNTDKTIEEISSDNGFANSHAFSQAFKKEYSTLPSSYRKAQRQSIAPLDYLPLEQNEYMAGLKKYLNSPTDVIPNIPSLSTHVSFSATQAKSPLRHTWKNMISIGKASDLLLSDIQNLLHRVQKEIGYSHIFFNGILSDDLHVYNIDHHGNPIYNYVYVDKIFDFLLSIGLKPFLQFSYMPVALAKKPDRILFGHMVSEPKDLKEWCHLIHDFMSHIIQRYCLEEVLTWQFSVWHQPDTPSTLYGFDNKQDFFRFYKQTYDVVKNQDNRLPFGTPAFFFLNTQKQHEWHKEFLEWTIQNQCVPDFINYDYYDTKLSTEQNNSKSTFGFIQSMTLNERTDGMKNFIKAVKKLLDEEKLSSLPVYVCEWNNTPSQQDLLNDTCYKSCYITKTILENYDKLESLSYWSLTDFMSEHPLNGDMLFGGLGLFTYNNLPKASYYALKLLAQLGDTFLGKGKGWFATRTDNDIRIIAYHYRHYSKLYTMGERFEMNTTERYSMFEPPQTLEMQIELQDMEDKTYFIKEYKINRDSGSLFDNWVRMGSIDPQTSEDMQLLEAASQPTLKQYRTTSTEHILNLNLSLELLEVRLIIIR